MAAGALALGVGHGCALSEARVLWCWGNNGANHVDAAIGTAVVVPAVPLEGTWAWVALGREASCAIDEDGAVHCWGVDLLDCGAGPQPPARVCVVPD
ncbi:MAG: hypothetical protein KF901_10260 [Myxococcales bacterium]|nr:hypothetical protein [Myxococcales bacterium]